MTLLLSNPALEPVTARTLPPMPPIVKPAMDLPPVTFARYSDPLGERAELLRDVCRYERQVVSLLLAGQASVAAFNRAIGWAPDAFEEPLTAALYVALMDFAERREQETPISWAEIESFLSLYRPRMLTSRDEAKRKNIFTFRHRGIDWELPRFGMTFLRGLVALLDEDDNGVWYLRQAKAWWDNQPEWEECIL